MKKFVSILLAFMLVLSNPVFSATNDPIKVIVNDSVLVFDVNPTVIDGRTVLPVATIFKALGLEVSYDGATKTVTGLSREVLIKLQINKNQASVNGKNVFLEVPATIINGRTMVPARFVTEATGASVNWDATTRTITISKSISNSSESTLYKPLIVDGGDLSGHREPNVVVDIGFGDRKYYAYTNEYGQLVKVTADVITLQDPAKEPVLSTGRYYPDEAKVPGVESLTLDEGHVIADSLGGVSNAYNITPQDSILNQHGDQAYMEKVIRDAGGCTDFVAIITYPNNSTQIPSHYSFTYTINGNLINDEFDNVNSDIANKPIEENQNIDVINSLIIDKVDLRSEEVVIKNISTIPVQLKGYKLVSVKGNQIFTFPEYLLEGGKTVTVYSAQGSGNLKWTSSNIWNNDGDPAELYDASGNLLDTK